MYAHIRARAWPKKGPPRQMGFDRIFGGYWDLIRHNGEGKPWLGISSQIAPYISIFPLLRDQWVVVTTRPTGT